MVISEHLTIEPPHESDNTYDSFSIEATLSDDVFIKIGTSQYKVGYTISNHVPTTIYDYDYGIGKKDLESERY